MFCPRCGQERVSQDTSFCSRCGFLLTGAAELLLTEGIANAGHEIAVGVDSPRRRGIKQGIFMIMLMIVLAPVFGIIFRFALNMMPWPVGVIVFLLGGGGLLRIIYSMMFESKYSDTNTAPVLVRGPAQRELPAGEMSTYIPPVPIRPGKWLDTNDLAPASVTDPTTQLLEKEQDRL